MKRRIKNKIAKRKGLIQGIDIAEKNRYQKRRKELINEYTKNIQKVNRKLTRIRRSYGKLQYSSEKLIKDITARSKLRKAYNIKTGRVQIRKSLSNSELESINVLFKRFLQSKTSTVHGIKTRRESAKEGIKQMFGDVDSEIDDESIEEFARTFQNADFRWLTRYGITESEFVTMVRDATSRNWTEEYWVERIIDYINIIPDLDMKDDLVNLYSKYVKGNYFGI